MRKKLIVGASLLTMAGTFALGLNFEYYARNRTVTDGLYEVTYIGFWSDGTNQPSIHFGLRKKDSATRHEASPLTASDFHFKNGYFDKGDTIRVTNGKEIERILKN